MSRAPYTPDGWHSVTPRIVARDAPQLVAFLKHVFGATGDYQPDRPAVLTIGDSLVMINEEGIRQATPAFLYVYVDNADEAYRRAIDLGARSIEEPSDLPYGDRRGMVEDSWGNVWQIATHPANTAHSPDAGAAIVALDARMVETGSGSVIRDAELSDGVAVAAIYNHYVSHTVVTFEEEPVAGTEIERRIEGVRSASLPWLVAEEGGRVVGYAYATTWRPRSAYRLSVEIAVYLAAGAGGRGIGSKLYGRLFPLLEQRGIHAVMGGIALPNEPSVALHEKFEMRKVAHFKDVGFKFGRWIDVGYWQRTFE